MTFLDCTTSFTRNKDNSSTFMINMDDAMTKCMTSVCKDPEFWIRNAIYNRCRIEGERIYENEVSKHLDTGTLPSNSTKKSLIVNYIIPE